jgi:hypothetical protein
MAESAIVHISVNIGAAKTIKDVKQLSSACRGRSRLQIR